jgi:hypothetical protein
LAYFFHPQDPVEPALDGAEHRVKPGVTAGVDDRHVAAERHRDQREQDHEAEDRDPTGEGH